MASQHHTTPDELASLARPNRLGHGHKTQGRDGKIPGRINDCWRHAKTLKTRGSGTVSTVKMAVRNDPGRWYSVGRDSLTL